jgi:ferredoxin-type protein NapH
MATMAGFLALALGGALWHSGIGAFSGFGIWSVAAVCPLGFLETVLAARSVAPWLLVPFLAIVVTTALYGRVFCGWICPVPLVRSWLPGSNGNPAGKNGNHDVRLVNVTETADHEARPWPALSVLAGTLVSASVFGFPVFCLVCPIGLILATGFAALHLVRTGQPSFDLMVFPAIVIIELVILKKWCSRLCPLGALLSLLSLAQRGLVPIVDRTRCLVETKGSRCHECQKGCEFDIDLKKPPFEGGINECSKCRVCADNCPARAISFPWWRG